MWTCVNFCELLWNSVSFCEPLWTSTGARVCCYFVFWFRLNRFIPPPKPLGDALPDFLACEGLSERRWSRLVLLWDNSGFSRVSSFKLWHLRDVSCRHWASEFDRWSLIGEVWSATFCLSVEPYKFNTYGARRGYALPGLLFVPAALDRQLCFQQRRNHGSRHVRKHPTREQIPCMFNV